MIEDCGAHHEAAIRERFGDAVAAIVLDCTDGTAEGKALHTSAEARRRDWLARKRQYVQHLAAAGDATLLVSGCDKLHNVRAIVQDLENPEVGTTVFARFTGGPDGTLAYYESLTRILVRREAPMACVFNSAVARMHALAGATERKALPLR